MRTTPALVATGTMWGRNLSTFSALRNEVKSNANDRKDVTGRNFRHENNCVVLLHTSAVKVVNLKTGKLALAYTQHDTASQATVISENGT